MATLSSALNYALAGLSVSSAQSAVVSRNVSSASDENYTRKSAEIVSLPGVGPAVSQITRSSDRMLLDRLLSASSESSERQVVLDALTRMSELTGDPQDGNSIAARIGKLQDSLRLYEQNPASTALAHAVLQDAENVGRTLNASSAELASIRTEADRSMAESADRLSNLLAQFKVVNDSIVRGQGTANDLTEALDQRDSILRLLSEEIGIRTTLRPNNDVLIYAEGGAVLFEGSPRNISFRPSDTLQPGTEGNALFIDGVPVTGPGAAMQISGGRISAQAKIRDMLAPQLSLQFDQIAAGLVIAFSESDPQIPSTLPTVEGLFTGTGTIPLLTDANTGLAGLIAVNGMADPDKGGNLFMIRDGGFGGTAYIRNQDGLAGFQQRIAELTDAIDTRLNFGIQGGLGGAASLKEFGAKSASWVELHRQGAKSSHDAASAATARAADTLSRVTGVNIDHEMATLLDLEKSYQASSKVLAVVNSMLDVLLDAAG